MDCLRRAQHAAPVAMRSKSRPHARIRFSPLSVLCSTGVSPAVLNYLPHPKVQSLRPKSPWLGTQGQLSFLWHSGQFHFSLGVLICLRRTDRQRRAGRRAVPQRVTRTRSKNEKKQKDERKMLVNGAVGSPRQESREDLVRISNRQIPRLEVDLTRAKSMCVPVLIAKFDDLTKVVVLSEQREPKDLSRATYFSRFAIHQSRVTTSRNSHGQRSFGHSKTAFLIDRACRLETDLNPTQSTQIPFLIVAEFAFRARAYFPTRTRMSDTDAAMPRLSLLEYFQPNSRPQNEIAVKWRRGYRMARLSYGELLRSATRFARELEARGIQKGDRVLLWGENSGEWVAAFLG